MNQNDYVSMIAFVMSSNLYLEGLSKINYMDLNQKLNGLIASNNTSMEKNQSEFSRSNPHERYSEKNDVLNGQTTQ